MNFASGGLSVLLSSVILSAEGQETVLSEGQVNRDLVILQP
jgi:hypothetical protein